MARRPACIRHWSEIEREAEAVHPATGEPRAFAADLGGATGLSRIGVRHERLMPGRRSSPPHAERDEEELVFILEGTPDLWQDGRLYRLAPGVAVGWPDRTGIAHCLINNSGAPVRYLTVGEASRYASKVHFPRDGEVAAWFARRGKLWTDSPKRRLGPHGGRPDAHSDAPSPKGARGRGLPPNAIDWRALDVQTGNTYPGDSEVLADYSHLSSHLGLGRIGGGIDTLQPGRRTSWPHAERDEEEFVFVLEGAPRAWLDGRLYPLRPGDFVGWPSGTGTAHTILNDGPEPAILVTFGEASRRRSRIWYPLHREYALSLCERSWTPPRPPRLAPHDGTPMAHRICPRRTRPQP